MHTARLSRGFAAGKRNVVARFVSRSGPERGSLRLSTGTTYRLNEISHLAFVNDQTIAYLQYEDRHGANLETARMRIGALREFDKLTVADLFEPVPTDEAASSRLINATRLARWLQTPRLEPALRGMIQHAARKQLTRHRPTSGTVLGLLMEDMQVSGINDESAIANTLAYVFFYNELLRATSHRVVAERNAALSEVQLALKELDSLPLCVTLDAAITSRTDGWSEGAAIADRVRAMANGDPTVVAPHTGILSFGIPGTVGQDTCQVRAVDLIGDMIARGTDRPCVLYSGDPRFLRAYAPRVLYYMSAFPEFDYHFLILAPQSEAVATAEALMRLQRDIAEFQRIAPGRVSVSYSAVPQDVSDSVSFYASARFLFAHQALASFRSGLWIQDIDLFPEGDFTTELSSMQRSDVSIVPSHALGGLLPWKRYLAGSVFFRDTGPAREFLATVTQYLRYWLTHGGQWMVDQNALSFAVENNPEVSIFDLAAARVPLTQSTVGARIERLV